MLCGCATRVASSFKLNSCFKSCAARSMARSTCAWRPRAAAAVLQRARRVCDENASRTHAYMVSRQHFVCEHTEFANCGFPSRNWKRRSTRLILVANERLYNSATASVHDSMQILHAHTQDLANMQHQSQQTKSGGRAKRTVRRVVSAKRARVDIESAVRGSHSDD